MPIVPNKPPDPPNEDPCYTPSLMTSPKNRHSSLGVSNGDLSNSAAGKKVGKHRKLRKGFKIKIPTPESASAGAGSILRLLRSSKINGKPRNRSELSPVDVRGGKRVVNIPPDDSISTILTNLKSGSIDSHLKFALGSNNDNSDANRSLSKIADTSNSLCGNDGSFIKQPLDVSPIQSMQGSPVARNCGLQTSLNHSSAGDVDSISGGETGSRDGIVGAKTGVDFGKGVAGSSVGTEHTSMEGVVNAGVTPSNSLNGIAGNKESMEFEFGRGDRGNGILKKPSVPLLSVQFGSNILGNPFIKSAATTSNTGNWSAGFGNAFGSTILSNQYSAVADRFAEKLKKGSEEMALKMEYTPGSVSVQDNGNRRIEFTGEEVYKGGQSCAMQLYGYFVGTSMDYRVVRANLMKMWKVYDIEDITKKSSGIYYFKFKSEEGMKTVLDSGPWMVQNVPIVLNVWEPGIWLEKAEPTTIPIWVCVYNIPMELCNGSGIGKIMSGVGRPMIMDKMTKERCLKKAGKLDFARVLVEVAAEEDLPNVLEISYPPIGNRPARIGKLEVKYQWKPPLCTYCKTFGHNTVSCKSRPKTQEEVAAQAIKDAINVKFSETAKGKTIVIDDEGFTTVDKNNKAVEVEQNSVHAKIHTAGGNQGNGRSSGMNAAPSKNLNASLSQSSGRTGSKVGVHLRNPQVTSRINSGPPKQNTSKQSNKRMGNGKSNVQQSNLNVKKGVYQVKNINNVREKASNVAQSNTSRASSSSFTTKSLQQLSKDPNFKPKVLVRGSGSNGKASSAMEDIPLSNTFSALNDEEMLENCLESNDKSQDTSEGKDWPELRNEVDVLLQAGIYPSKLVRLDWNLHQLDYFYKNCHKYELDPIPDNDEDDVSSEYDGISNEMKPEYDVNAASNIGNDAAPLKNVSNGI